LLLSERGSDVVDAVEHSEFLSHWLNVIVRQKRHGCREESSCLRTFLTNPPSRRDALARNEADGYNRLVEIVSRLT